METKFRKIRSAVAFLLFAITCNAQQIAQISIGFEVYDDAGGYKKLYFGLDQSATDGIDYQLGESDLPPYPPSGAFDVRWLLPENNFSGSLSSWKDYRYVQEFPYSGTYEHRIRYQSVEGATKMLFSWNLPPEVTGLLQDLINGTYVNVPINGNGTYELTNFSVINKLKLMVFYNNIVTSIADEKDHSLSFALEQNFPNPFNPSTKIKFTIPQTDNPFLGGARGALVTLKVYDILGNEITTLINEEKLPGVYEVEFNSHSDEGQNLSSGTYFYTLRAGNFVQTKKMIVIK